MSGWGFPSQPLPYAETHVDFHVSCLLLFPNFNQNWNVVTDFSKTHQYQIQGNPHSNPQVVTYGEKLTGAFLQLQLQNMPKNVHVLA
jgi:hypothetical protein